jgi:hypothetical protein
VDDPHDPGADFRVGVRAANHQRRADGAEGDAAGKKRTFFPLRPSH